MVCSLVDFRVSLLETGYGAVRVFSKRAGDDEGAREYLLTFIFSRLQLLVSDLSFFYRTVRQQP